MTKSSVKPMVAIARLAAHLTVMTSGEVTASVTLSMHVNQLCCLNANLNVMGNV